MKTLSKHTLYRQRDTRLSTSSLIIALLFALIFYRPVSAQTISCDDVFYVIEQSHTGFLSIQSDVKNETGGFKATYSLPGAHYCNIIEDVEKRSYRCTWKYSIGDGEAEAEYEQLADSVLSCLGSSASVAEDQPVNHPDTYKSYIYSMSDTEVRITLKDKSELKSTFVSIVVDGQHVSK